VVALTGDRPALLRLADEKQRLIDETAGSSSPQAADRHARALLTLAAVRHKLGELPEAEQLCDQAAIAFSEIGTPRAREFAAAARVEQAGLAMASGRSAEALGILERLIEQSGGFPRFERFPAMRPGGLDVWLCLLEERADFERLYEAAGTALALLDPADPATDRFVLAKAAARRAKAAEALGYRDEAVDRYTQAVDLFEAEDPTIADGYLAPALCSLALLLATLGRADDLSAAFERIVARYIGRPEPWAQDVVAVARFWMKPDKG
jgi:tetratricopeptide (TPR) repeat protein